MIANQSAVADARTTFEALADTALQNASSTGVWRALAREHKPNGSIAHTFTFPGATPAWKEFTGTRHKEGFRKYAKTVGLKKYDKTIELDRADVEYDQDGSTALALEQHMNDGESFWDKLVLAKLVENDTCADGAALISDSHPYASGGGTWDNKTTTALSFASFNTERARMRALKNENGEPLNLDPKVLVCHPDDEEMAMTIAGSDVKPVSVGTAGAINTAGIGGSYITNYFRGKIDVILTSRITSGDWVIVDPRYAPIGFCVWKKPMPVIVDSLTSDSAVNFDKFIYMMIADAAAACVQPWGIAGKLS